MKNADLAISYQIRVLCKRTLSVRKVCPQRSAFVVVAGVLQNGKLARCIFVIEISEVVGSSGLFVAVARRAVICKHKF